MFETSFVLFIKSIIYNVLIPILPGILFLWLFVGKKIYGILLYILGWFMGVGVVAFSLFNLQFFYFGIGVGEYLFIFLILLSVFVLKLFYKKQSIKEYLITMKINSPIKEIKKSFINLPKIEKIFTIIGGLFGLTFIIITFIHTINFPTYADDSFGNRNGPALNIYQDGGVKLFGEKTEILGRGRMGYPIYIPIYKALVSDFIGSYNDIYINVWQRLVFFFLILFSTYFTWTKTKNIFYTMLPSALICSLPLVYFHSVEGYMELACAAYSVVTIRLFYKFLDEKDYSYISLALLSGFILSHIKNDGLLGYFIGILISFAVILIIKKDLTGFLKGLWQDKKNLYSSIFYLIFFLFPFLFIRYINHLGLNPVATADGSVGLSKTIHREIFSVFPSIFVQMDNYNVILIILFVLLRLFLSYQKTNIKKYFLVLPGIAIFVIFTLVFLLTENYMRVMNQTTVNRVFTMCFVIILSFSGLLIYNKDE